MGRFLVLALLLFILWMAVGNFVQKLRAAVSGDAPPAQDILLPCAACGTFVPASRVVAGKGAEVYCSEECRMAN